MNDVSSTIGGVDGPVSYFVAGKTGADWINLFGLIIVVCMLIPNIIYAIKYRGMENSCKSKVWNITEQLGRYISMFLMVFNIGIAEFGFNSVGAFLVYAFGNIVLLAAYWIVWICYFVKQGKAKQMALAVIPTGIFLVSGITLEHWLLVASGILFGIGHIYITSCNASQYRDSAK